jgi:peptidylprolyl isomerase
MSNATPEVRAFEGVKATCEAFKGGPEIDKVKVTAETNKVPSVSFATAQPGSSISSALAKIETTETKIVREGSGPAFTGDQLVTIEYAVFSSTSGALLSASKWDGLDVASPLFNSNDTKQFCDALGGVKQGSVVAFAFPATETDPEGSLFVLALKKVYLPKANGSSNPPESGFPAIVLDPSTGRPGLLQPGFPAPEEFKRATLISGKGDVIKIGDSVTLHYTGWVWTEDIGDPFDSSWLPRDAQTPASPATFTIKARTPQEEGLIDGFVSALEGIAVGSQVLAILPPEVAYGALGNGSSIPGNATLIFVIDVLGINK